MTAVGGVKPVHGDGLWVTGERLAAEAAASSLLGPLGGAAYAVGAVATSVGGIKASAGGERLQHWGLAGVAENLEVAQACREGAGATATGRLWL